MSPPCRQGNGSPLPTAHFEQEVRMTLEFGAPGSQAWYICPSVQRVRGPQGQGPGVWQQCLRPVPSPPPHRLPPGGKVWAPAPVKGASTPSD